MTSFNSGINCGYITNDTIITSNIFSDGNTSISQPNKTVFINGAISVDELATFNGNVVMNENLTVGGNLSSPEITDLENKTQLLSSSSTSSTFSNDLNVTNEINTSYLNVPNILILINLMRCNG
jgi:hypothetical protein